MADSADARTDCLLFVFQEQHSKTDVPRSELLSLLEMHLPGTCLNVVSAGELKKDAPYFTFDSDIEKPEGAFARVVFLEQSAVVLSNRSFDLAQLMASAGYLQSAGPLLFLCEWGTLDVERSVGALARYALRAGERLPIAFYTSSTQKEYADRLQPLCIDDSRYHIGQRAFATASRDIVQGYDEACSDAGVERTGSGHIVIYRDQSLGSARPLDRLYPDRRLVDFAVGYASSFKKDNPIHLLDGRDEAKPYWAGIFTTPHRLVNAMLNMAHVVPDDLVVDPFCHTGTVAIEAATLGARVIAADKNEPQGARDNFDLLCGGHAVLRKTTRELRDLAADDSVQSAFNDLAASGIEMNRQGLPEVKSGKNVEELYGQAAERGLDFSRLSHRLYFYLVRRYQMQRARGVKLAKQARDFVKQLCGDEMQNSEGTYFAAANIMEAYEDVANAPSILNAAGLFSDESFKSSRVGWRSKKLGEAVFIKRDILSGDDYGIQPDSASAVVTDPPYGYGEGLDGRDVAQLYDALFRKSFRWLRSGGRLVCCALDKVKTGRSEGLLFTEDILARLNRVMRESGVAFSLKHVTPVKDPPEILHYWKSKYALNRVVISIQIEKGRP